MKLQLLISFLFVLLFSSCEKVDDLLDPKDGDEKNEALLVGTWNVDSLAYGHNEQSTDIVYDTITINDGTFEFGPRSTSLGSGYGVGFFYHRHIRNGMAITDTMNWYSGNWGSSSLAGTNITIFQGRLSDGSFNSNTDVHFSFLQKDKTKVRLAGTRAYTTSNGIVVRHHYRYVISK